MVPSSFDRILYSPKNWVFLTADTKVTVAGEEGFIIGDGVTPTTVSRTDGGTVIDFTINGPAPDPVNNPADLGPIVATSNLFTVSGHIAGMGIPQPATIIQPPPAQTTDTVTIIRARLRSNTVEVRATSSNGFSMTGELLRSGVVVGSANLGTSGRGNISFTAAPDTVRVHSTSTNPAILSGVATAQVTN